MAHIEEWGNLLVLGR